MDISLRRIRRQLRRRMTFPLQQSLPVGGNVARVRRREV